MACAFGICPLFCSYSAAGRRDSGSPGPRRRLRPSAARHRLPQVSPTPSTTPTHSLAELRDALRRFATERDWEQFHSPKNLAIALSVEAAELLEHFQWQSEAGSATLDAAKVEAVRDEMADVLLYLIRLADRLDVDLLAAAAHKIDVNARRYPIDKARGSSRKYTEL
ncbi:MAG: nucleotide pyrophosphohydrolase [Acetobacteraceae bacterium]|nr:nucleotide pyrophosphohydrolase [Acetobacteraceae bacterium]